MRVRAVIIVLLLVGLTGTLGRTTSSVEVLTSSPRPELSTLDEASLPLVGTIARQPEGSAARRDLDDQSRRFAARFYEHSTMTLLHVVAATVFLLLAPWQFSARFRSRHPPWHRWSGRVILAMSLPIGISGLFFGVLVPFAGPGETSCIVFFAALFLLCGTRGLIAIRQRRIDEHREWMTRLFAIALGTSTVRLVTIVLAAISREGPITWFAPALWIGFSGTSLYAEWWIRSRRRAAGTPIAPSEDSAASSPATSTFKRNARTNA